MANFIEVHYDDGQNLETVCINVDSIISYKKGEITTARGSYSIIEDGRDIALRIAIAQKNDRTFKENLLSVLADIREILKTLR